MSIDYIIILVALSAYTLLNLYLLRKVSKVESRFVDTVSYYDYTSLSKSVSNLSETISDSPTLKSEYANKKLKEAQALISKLGDK